MNQVPEMISTKDLLYLEDMMNWNLTDAKTASHYEKEVQDPEIKEKLHGVAMMHKNHFRELLAMLEIGGN